MPKTTTETFLKAFSNFPEYVFVWKLPNASMRCESSPPKYYPSSWIPQNDLLGHNKTKLFISHCGSNGLHEALYHAVPIVGFPLFAEQHHNAFNIETRGFGKYLDIRAVTSDELVRAMTVVLNNKAF